MGRMTPARMHVRERGTRLVLHALKEHGKVHRFFFFGAHGDEHSMQVMPSDQGHLAPLICCMVNRYSSIGSLCVPLLLLSRPSFVLGQHIRLGTVGERTFFSGSAWCFGSLA